MRSRVPPPITADVHHGTRHIF